MPYLPMPKPRATTGVLANSIRSPYLEPATPPQAKTAFQQPTYTQAQIDQSLAANPYASKGGYEGSTPMPAQYTPSPAAQAPSSLYDPTTDPIYQKIKQLGTSQVSEAVAGGDALRKQILIGLGDPAFAHQQQFGDPTAPVYGDTSTEQAAAQNPYSTLAQLGQTHTVNDANIDTAANKGGGYWSSTHANQLANENQGYNQGINSAEGDASTQLSNIVQSILQAQNSAQSANIGAEGAATQTAISDAIANGYTVATDPATGEPVFTPPAPAGTATTPTATATAPTGATGGATGATGTTAPPAPTFVNTAMSSISPITQAVLAWAANAGSAASAPKAPSAAVTRGLTARQARQNFSGIGV